MCFWPSCEFKSIIYFKLYQVLGVITGPSLSAKVLHIFICWSHLHLPEVCWQRVRGTDAVKREQTGAQTVELRLEEVWKRNKRHFLWIYQHQWHRLLNFYLTKTDRYIFIFKLQPQNAPLQKEQQKKNTKLLVYTKKCPHHAADVFSSSLSSDFSPQCHLYLQSCTAQERITGRVGARLQVRPSCCQKAAAGVQLSQMKIASLWKAPTSLTHSGKKLPWTEQFFIKRDVRGKERNGVTGHYKSGRNVQLGVNVHNEVQARR